MVPVPQQMSSRQVLLAAELYTCMHSRHVCNSLLITDAYVKAAPITDKLVKDLSRRDIDYRHLVG
jgi:alcohol dehydrogenase class IV